KAASAKRRCAASGRATASRWDFERMLAVAKLPMNLEYQLTVQDLNARYVEAIDDDNLEAWPDFFTDDGRYRVTTAENVPQNLPVGMLYATSRAMLRD